MAADTHGVEMQPLQAADPRTLGRHRVLGRLGAGGMGVVYLAEGPLGRLAVKLIRHEYADDPQFRTRFQREVQACFRVGGTHTARLVDFELDADRPWLATEFIDAPDLGDQVGAHGPLPATDQVVLAAGLAAALASIHAVGLVHRDLKPSNVLWTPDGPKVIDFGIAAASEARPLTVIGGVVGTPGWLSPEQAVGGEITTASDIFGWGALVCYGALGQPPFGTGADAVVAQRIATAELQVDESRLAEELRPLVRWALDREPARRPSAAELCDRLSAHLGGGWIAATRVLTDAARTPTPPGQVIPAGPAEPSGSLSPHAHRAQPAGPGAGGWEADGAAPVKRAGAGGTRRRRLWIAGAVAVVVLAVAGILVALLTSGGGGADDGDGDGASADEPASTSAVFTTDAPWRLAVSDEIQGEDNGCTVTVTNLETGEQHTVRDVYGTRSYQVPLVGGFQWEVNDPGCVVSGQAGSGAAVLPFAQQGSTGDTDAFAAPPGLVAVEVVDFNGSEECELELRDAADGRVVAFGSARPDASPLLLDPSGRSEVYLSDLSCGVRVSAATN